MSAKDNVFDGDKNAKAIIFGLESLILQKNETDFFKDYNPLGFILFKRNCDNPSQILALTNALRDCLGRDCPILIDQEGGRVQRMGPPHWRAYPPAQDFGERAAENIETAIEALRFHTLQMAQDLKECGVNVNCTPVLDVLSAATHDVIGNRSFSSDPKIVARLGLSVCRHYLAAGMTPIIKHIPGHGRAAADSHLELPVVDADHQTMQASDFYPFTALAQSDVGHQIWAMTAHVIYNALDKALPATISPGVIRDTIRGEIGFQGILIGDDLDMKALAAYGDIGQRAALTLKAGCDLALHCSGDFSDMQIIAAQVGKISPETQKRLQNSQKSLTVAA